MGADRRFDPLLLGNPAGFDLAVRPRRFFQSALHLPGILGEAAMHLVDRVERWAQAAPDRLAHVTGGRSLTYGELSRRSDTLAAQLGRLLPPDRSPVVILGHKEPEMLIGFLG